VARPPNASLQANQSASLLAVLRAHAAENGIEIELLKARLDDLGQLLAGRRLDLVCAHGLLMYLDDRRSALHALATLVVSGGHLSATFRNGAALAFRPGIRQDWHAALSAFGAASYVNELGVQARADTLDQVAADLDELAVPGDDLVGLRMFTDPASADERHRRTPPRSPRSGRRRPRRPDRRVPPSRIASSRDRGPTLIDHLRQRGAHSTMSSRGFSWAPATHPGTTGTLPLRPGTLQIHRAGGRHRWRAACAIAAAP